MHPVLTWGNIKVSGMPVSGSPAVTCRTSSQISDGGTIDREIELCAGLGECSEKQLILPNATLSNRKQRGFFPAHPGLLIQKKH